MGKPKLFIYPTARDMIHDSISGFENTIPMCKEGIHEHFEVITDPDQADYFFMGQVADKDAWQLHPNRFEFFVGNETKHIIDLEGDWRDMDHPAWLEHSLIITGHARIDSKAKFINRFVRPVISPLLVRLACNRPSYDWPVKRGFWFQGQRDSRGLREKVRLAIEQTGLPYEYKFNGGWALYSDQYDPIVREYLDKAYHWAFALCPVGEGPSCRFYEMALLGRPPILIGDYMVFGEYEMCSYSNFPWTIRTDCTVEKIAYELNNIYNGLEEAEMIAVTIRYGAMLERYFNDPTGYYLTWLQNPLRRE